MPIKPERAFRVGKRGRKIIRNRTRRIERRLDPQKAWNDQAELIMRASSNFSGIKIETPAFSADFLLFVRGTSLVIFFGLFFPGVLNLPAQEEQAPAQTPTPETEQPLNIDIPTVEGQDVLGIRIPHHDEEGKLVFQLSAEKARRLNDQDVEMEDMELIFYDDQDEKFEVTIPHSTFNLETKQLSGDRGAVISREDFTIEGQIIDFDLTKQSGVLRGDVTMTIHQIDRLEP